MWVHYQNTQGKLSHLESERWVNAVPTRCQHRQSLPSHRFTFCVHITYCFLKRAPHEWTEVLPVDAMASDGHEVTLGCHDVTQQGQVTVVDI